MSAASELQQELIGRYTTTSANVLFLYETIVTFSQEVEVIWRRRWTLMTWLYAMTRYSMVSLEILLLVPTWSQEDCKVVQYMASALQLSQYLYFALFSALRVYALLDGKMLQAIVAGLVFVLNIIPFAVNLYNIATAVVLTDTEACRTVPTLPEALMLTLSLTNRTAVSVGDTLVLIVTWTKTIQLYKNSRRLKVKAPLAAILLRDGTLWYMLLLLMNVLQAVETNVPALVSLNIVEPFFDIISPLVVCRFILNLRQVERTGGESSMPHIQSKSILFVGNIGQSLQFSGGQADEEHRDGYLNTGVPSTEDLEVDAQARDDIGGNSRN